MAALKIDKGVTSTVSITDANCDITLLTSRKNPQFINPWLNLPLQAHHSDEILIQITHQLQ